MTLSLCTGGNGEQAATRTATVRGPAPLGSSARANVCDVAGPVVGRRVQVKGPPAPPHPGAVLLVVCFSTALRRLNEQEWMLPCDSPSKSSIEKWYRQLLKFPIGYVGYVGYNNKLPYMGE